MVMLQARSSDKTLGLLKCMLVDCPSCEYKGPLNRYIHEYFMGCHGTRMGVPYEQKPEYHLTCPKCHVTMILTLTVELKETK